MTQLGVGEEAVEGRRALFESVRSQHRQLLEGARRLADLTSVLQIERDELSRQDLAARAARLTAAIEEAEGEDPDNVTRRFEEVLAELAVREEPDSDRLDQLTREQQDLGAAFAGVRDRLAAFVGDLPGWPGNQEES